MRKIILSISILFTVFISGISQTPQPYIYKESGEIRLTATLVSPYSDSSNITLLDRRVILDTASTTHFLFNVRGVIQTINQNKNVWDADQETSTPVIVYTAFKVTKVTISDGLTQPSQTGTGQDHTVMVRIE